MGVTALMLGHSFMPRLDKYLQDRGISNMYIEQSECDIELISRKFLYVDEIYTPAVWRLMWQRQPNVVLVDIGTNDLDSERLSPVQMAHKVVDWAEELITSLVYNV